MTSKRSQNGLTLLEIVLGLALLGIAVLGLTLAVVPGLKSLSTRSEAPQDWLHAARSTMERIIHRCEQGSSASDAICTDQAEVTDCPKLCREFDVQNCSRGHENGTPSCEVFIQPPAGSGSSNIVLCLPRKENNG